MIIVSWCLYWGPPCRETPQDVQVQSLVQDAETKVRELFPGRCVGGSGFGSLHFCASGLRFRGLGLFSDSV